MGTNSVTVIHSKGRNSESLVNIYTQYDSGFEDLGKDLQEFLNGMIITNGLPIGNMMPSKIANGMSCLAAQIVAHFKKRPGNVYLIPPTEDVNYNYAYHIYLDENNKLCLDGSKSGGLTRKFT